jgi:hypothetical protein
LKVRFQADANLRHAILRGCLRLEPTIDFRSGPESGLEGLHDLKVLERAAREGRILVTHDTRSMPRHFADFLSRGKRSGGVILIPQDLAVASAIEVLLLLWLESEAEEWEDRIIWLPL